MKLDFNDILIVPKQQSDILSRSEVNPYHDEMLPLFTAPMDTVVSSKNIDKFFENKINIVLPRHEKSIWNLDIESHSLKEFKSLINSYHLESENIRKRYFNIDIANGHMTELVDVIRNAKSKYPEIILMVGNIANPKTYEILSEAGADYVRLGVGNGGSCLTTKNLGVGYPMASLIKECYDISLTLKTSALIVADGGMKDYSDIIKALALGANYVMIGNIFNKCIESAGDNYLWGRIKVPQLIAEKAYSFGVPVYKKFRGMSTKEVQKKWGLKKLKTSEDVVRFRKVEYTLAQWCENFEDYLRSAMGYTGAKTLSDFIGEVETIQITDNAYKRFNK